MKINTFRLELDGKSSKSGNNVLYTLDELVNMSVPNHRLVGLRRNTSLEDSNGSLIIEGDTLEYQNDLYTVVDELWAFRLKDLLNREDSDLILCPEIAANSKKRAFLDNFED